MRERSLGILGKKVGMTRFFEKDGRTVGVAVLELGPCVVIGKRTKAQTPSGKSDGYTALRLGFDGKATRKVSKPEAGIFKAVDGKARRFVREIRVTEDVLAKFSVGQEITVKDLGWQVGDLIDVTGKSKGRGFQGVMKRHHFAGFPKTHGTHEYRRHGGSIGCRKWPGWVMKGRRMPGHMGDERVTIQNLRVVEIRETENLVMVEGAVPGAKTGYLLARHAIKRRNAPQT